MKKKKVSIKEGLKKLVQEQQKEESAELSKIIESQKADIRLIRDEMSRFLAEMSKNRERIQKIENINQKLDDLKGLDEELKKLNIKDITKDIETLKTKILWMEKQQLNLQPMYSKIQHLENEIIQLRASLPKVIE